MKIEKMRTKKPANFSWLLLIATTAGCGGMQASGITAWQRDAGILTWDSGESHADAQASDRETTLSPDATQSDAGSPDQYSATVDAAVVVADAAQSDSATGYDATWPTLPPAQNFTCDDVDCSGHGQFIPHDQEAVCACDSGFSPGDALGHSCVLTDLVVVGGSLSSAVDVDYDGSPDSEFYPNADEKRMYELVNYTRATHDMEGSHECFRPLAYDQLWSAHGRNHSLQMLEQGGLFHADYPMGQNCAYGGSPETEINMYMTGPSEPHCDALSHHCNIMRCSFSRIGIGTVSSYNTQNFY